MILIKGVTQFEAIYDRGLPIEVVFYIWHVSCPSNRDQCTKHKLIIIAGVFLSVSLNLMPVYTYMYMTVVDVFFNI